MDELNPNLSELERLQAARRRLVSSRDQLQERVFPTAQRQLVTDAVSGLNRGLRKLNDAIVVASSKERDNG